MRKHNDIYKLQFLHSRQILEDESDSNAKEIKVTMSKILDCVFRIFFRLSLTMESENEYFSLGFYQKLVYDNWIFDMAKLIDLAAIYGKSNREVTMQIISNVYENDQRYLTDFKETFDLLINVLKNTFGKAFEIN